MVNASSMNHASLTYRRLSNVGLPLVTPRQKNIDVDLEAYGGLVSVSRPPTSCRGRDLGKFLESGLQHA